MERKQRREREKSERQQVQLATKNHHEVAALFPELRRVNPSEGDDDIAAKLGDYSKAKELINRQMLNNTVLTGIVPPSASVIGGGGGIVGMVGGMGPISPLPPCGPPMSSSTSALPPYRQLPPPLSQQQQPSQHYRGVPPSSVYQKQQGEKPQPYNGRGMYPGQMPSRSSSMGMAPPKGPSSHGLGGGSGAPLLPPPPPFGVHMPNGRHSLSSSSSASSAMIDGHKPYSSSVTHNGRYMPHPHLQPVLPNAKQQSLRQKQIPQEVSLEIERQRKKTQFFLNSIQITFFLMLLIIILFINNTNYFYLL